MQAAHFDVRAPAASYAQALTLLGVEAPAAWRAGPTAASA